MPAVSGIMSVCRPLQFFRKFCDAVLPLVKLNVKLLRSSLVKPVHPKNMELMSVTTSVSNPLRSMLSRLEQP